MTTTSDVPVANGTPDHHVATWTITEDAKTKDIQRTGQVRSDGSEVIAHPTAAANGLTPSRIKSGGSTNATSVKATPGNMYELAVFNNAAYTVYLKFYNKASAPTVGTDTPLWTVPIPAGGGFEKSWRNGKGFSTGIAYAITKLEADNDATAVLADDLTGTMDWI